MKHENLKIKSLLMKGFQNKRNVQLFFKDVTVLVGKNGSGKTTLLRTIESLLLDRANDISDISGEVIVMFFSDGERANYARVQPGDFNLSNNEIVEKGVQDIFKEVSIKEEIKSLSLRENILKDIIKSKLENYISELVSKRLMEQGNKVLKYSNDSLASKLANIQVRYISTVLISANSEKEMSFGNSKTKNILDVSIELELALLKTKGTLAINKFIDSINDLFLDTNKLLTYKPKKGFLVNMKGDDIPMDALSSGEKQLIFILATAANTIGGPAVFLMDEPEISLHLSWQEKIIDAVKRINSDIQLIVATHSPAIVMNGYMDSYIDMNSIDMKDHDE